MSQVFRLQLVERPNRMVETRAIGYAHATVPLPLGPDELSGLLADGAFARLGQTLYDVLFPPGEVRDSLAEALAVTRAARQPLTMQLHLDVDSPALARYPWELIHDGQSFLVADGIVALARYVGYAQGIVPSAIQVPLRLLLVSPRPADCPEAGERLANPILAALDDLRKHGLVQVDLLSPPTYSALRQVLSKGAYQVLHFDGASGFDPLDASAEPGYLVLEDEQGAAGRVGGSALYNALFLSQVRLAVLTPPQAGLRPGATGLAGLAPMLLKAGVPAVVAMQQALPDGRNERFAAQLYQSLAGLAPLGVAVAHARGQLLPPESTRFAPVVYLQNRESGGELLAGPGEKPEPRPIGYVPSAPGRISAGYRPDVVFVDRSQAVIQTLQALAGPNNRLCLWGLGGVGKTSVAREIVRRAGWRFPGGLIWLRLQGGRSLAALLADIAAHYGTGKLPARLEDATRQVTALLAERTMAEGEVLLVLDNLEDMASDADLGAFLADLPVGVRVLATSRREPDPGIWQGLELRAMTAQDIERILRQKIASDHIAVSAADEPLLAEISELLDGYPLGVDLVVSLTRHCPWRHIRDELRAQPPPPLTAILRTTISQGLDDEQRRVAMRLAVLRGRFDETAIVRLSGSPRWLPQAQRLRELALLSFDGASYAFDVPVREYLYSLLSPEEARRCHEQAYRYFAGRRDLDGRIEAFQQAMAAGHYDAARPLLRDKLMGAMIDSGRYRQLLTLLQTALDIPATFDERFLLARASVLRILGRLPEALQSLEKLLAVPDLAVPTRALAFHEQGRIFYELDDEERGGQEQALDLYAQALAICDDLPSDGMDRNERRRLDAEMAALFQDIAIVYQYARARPDDLAFARRLYRASAGLWQRLRDPVSRAISDKQRAEILRQGSAQDKAEAKRIYRQLLQTLRRKGQERAYAEALLQLAKLYQDEQAFKHALRRFQEYEEIQHRLGLEREEAMAWKQQGEIYQEVGYRGRSIKRAIELYSRALERLEQLADRWSRRAAIAALLRRGEAHLELAMAEAAQRDFTEALHRSLAMGMLGQRFEPERLSEHDRRRLIWAYCALARSAAGTEAAEACADHLDPVLAVCRSLGCDAAAGLDCRTLLDLPEWARHHTAKGLASPCSPTSTATSMPIRSRA